MSFSIKAQKRTDKNVDEVRAEGLVPGVVYGPDRETTSISVNSLELQKLYNEAGESTLIDFSVDSEEPVKVLIQDLQFEPVKGNIIHVDFRQIQMGVEMEATVELEFVGMAPAVKEMGGTLSTNKDSVDIKCLPKDLVSSIQVDLSSLKTFEDGIHVKDLPLPQGITCVDDGELLVAKVLAPLSEEELKAMEEGDNKGVEDIEVEEKGKKEEEGEGEGTGKSDDKAKEEGEKKE